MNSGENDSKRLVLEPGTSRVLTESRNQYAIQEIAHRRRLEEQIKALQSVETPRSTRATLDGPDFEEGPNSTLGEEEWHDALDAELERSDIETNRVRL